MKIHTLALFLSASALSASALSAANPALPSLSERLLDRPELSLSEAVKSGQLPPFDPGARTAAEILRSASTGHKRLVSRMPVIEPSAEVDRNMPVIAPRADIDLKMLVKEPSVDSVR